MTTLILTVGDTAPTLTGTINANAAGATGEVHLHRPDATVVSRACTFPATAVAESSWSLELIDGDLDQGSDSGLGAEYRVEVEVTFSNAKVQTFALDAKGRPVSFFVRDQYA